MPLIMVCGYPCSGKSSVVAVLVQTLRSLEPSREVTVIAEPMLGTTVDNDPRASIYADSTKERELRGHHKSEVERALSGGSGTGGKFADRQHSIVIMDAGNYIKGYRYELYCLAKSLKHSHAVLFCDTSAEVVAEWNAKIQRYPPDLLSDMITRFEAPQASHRWDSPLLSVQPHLWPSPQQINVDSVIAELQRTVLSLDPVSVKPNRSTQIAQIAPTDFLQELERTTQSIIEHILQVQAMGAQSVSLPPPFQTKPGTTNRINLMNRPTPFSLPKLARAKRRYIGLQKSKLSDATGSHELPDASSIATGFMNYIACCDGPGDSIE